jgi:hypothetical protein
MKGEREWGGWRRRGEQTLEMQNFTPKHHEIHPQVNSSRKRKKERGNEARGNSETHLSQSEARLRDNGNGARQQSDTCARQESTFRTEKRAAHATIGDTKQRSTTTLPPKKNTAT